MFLTGLALAALGAIRAATPSFMPDPELLIREGSEYAAEHYALIARALAIGLFLSCGLAWVAYRVGPARQASTSRPHDALWTVFHESTGPNRTPTGGWAPLRLKNAAGDGATVPIVEIRMRDDVCYRGQVAAVDPGGARADRMIALACPITMDRGNKRTTIDRPWQRLILPLEDVAEMHVAFGVHEPRRAEPRLDK